MVLYEQASLRLFNDKILMGYKKQRQIIY